MIRVEIGQHEQQQIRRFAARQPRYAGIPADTLTSAASLMVFSAVILFWHDFLTGDPALAESFDNNLRALGAQLPEADRV